MSNILDEILQESCKLNSETKEITEESAWKDRCKSNLELFCKHYFPDVFTSDFCRFHRDVFSSLEKYVLDPEYKNTLGGGKKMSIHLRNYERSYRDWETDRKSVV